jgi:hypothetical protein
MLYSNLEKNMYFSTYPPPTLIHLSSASKPASIEVFWLLSQPFPRLCFNLFVISGTFDTKVEPLYATYTSRHKQETFLYEHPLHWVLLPTKTPNRTLLFGNTLLRHGTQFDYWNQSLNMSMRVCYLDCHEVGLCCYLVIHIENLYVHYSRFTSICDLFTDTPSY